MHVPRIVFLNRIASTKSASLALALVTLLCAASGGAAEPVTYSKDVAPIFFNRCANCHRPNEVAPMSLLEYREARPWAKAIAREVTLGNMPPFSGDSDHLKWKNDISLTQTEIDTIVKWVQQGALEGNPRDLPAQPIFTDGWKLGEPDYIVTLDKIDVPAGGDDLFPKQTATIDIDEPKWVRAMEFRPGDRRVAHHSLTTYTSPTNRNRKSGETAASTTGILGVWTAGMQPFEFPEGLGRVIGPGTRLLIDSHYHPIGEATTDQTRIGLYFGEGELEKEVTTMIAANTGIRIPPGAPNHEEVANHIFDRDMKIVAFSPHLHVRGKAMRYELFYPDGEREILLDVPNYNYNWQWLYYPTEPVEVPAGSRLEVTAAWDNSKANFSNPDPTKEIIYRGNTFNEMFVGFFEVVEAEGVYHKPSPAAVSLTALLNQHPPESSYIAPGFMPVGIFAPKQGEGWLYLAQAGATFSISLDDFEWDGDKLTIRTQFPTANASATTTLIEAVIGSDGNLKGTIKYGSDLETPMLTLPLNGSPLASTGG